MTELTMHDAAYLPENTSGCDVWAGYISGAATHIWDDNDWRRISHYPKLPIAVSRVDKTGTYCGLEAIMAIYKLGIPRSTAVAADLELLFEEPGKPLDEEIAAAIKWLNEFHAVIKFFGYFTWKYGSLSYLFRLPPVDGTWIATDSHIREQYNHPGVLATQYLFENDIDVSIIHRVAVHHRLSESWGING